MFSVYPSGGKPGVVNSPTKENLVAVMTGSSRNGYWQNTLKFCPDWMIAGRKKSFLVLKYRMILIFLQFQPSLLVSPKTKSGVLVAAVHKGFGPVGGKDPTWIQDGNHTLMKLLSVKDSSFWFWRCSVPHLEATDLQTLQISIINHLEEGTSFRSR